ncbi:IucA/IucC family protein [Acrocarpospora sp. B8E8]|uniref:IucA/IucC family protein n=1 Tax=Acrocarpospora sp. B8E8 TaxID=3153572 RepID=UPI00325CA804
MGDLVISLPRRRGVRAVPAREAYLAARVLNALLREDYGGLAARVTRDKAGVALELASGRKVRLTSGGFAGLFQDFVVASDEELELDEILETLADVAEPEDTAGVAAFAEECRETLLALDLYAAHDIEAGLLTDLLADGQNPRKHGHDGNDGAGRSPEKGGGGAGRSPGENKGLGGWENPGVLQREKIQIDRTTIGYESLAACVDHPIYPTARCRSGLSSAELLAYAPEFSPTFELRWAAVPKDSVISRGVGEFWPGFSEVGLRELGMHVLFPVHPLSVGSLPGVIVGPVPYLRVRPTLSMRTVEVDSRTHLKLPLATSTLGARNRRSIRPGTLRDGAEAERLLRGVLDRESGLRVLLADEQTYAHAGEEYLAWMIRRLPEGEIVSVAALAAPGVLPDLADRHYEGDITALLRDYLSVLFAWNVTLFVRYGIALEAHQQNLALVFGDGPMHLLVKDNDGLLAAPDRLAASGLEVPAFGDQRMFTDDPHALADVFVTITLHLAAAAITVGALGEADLVRATLSEALDAFGDDPTARLLRARTLDAARLVGKSMVTAGTLVDKHRTGARDINKFYGTSGPNYLLITQRSV